MRLYSLVRPSVLFGLPKKEAKPANQVQWRIRGKNPRAAASRCAVRALRCQGAALSGREALILVSVLHDVAAPPVLVVVGVE
jgi:hypothetical protein